MGYYFGLELRKAIFWEVPGELRATSWVRKNTSVRLLGKLIVKEIGPV